MKRKWMKFILTGVFVAGLVGSSYATSFADVKLDGELISINGEYRLRPEFRDNADFNKSKDDSQSFYLQRIRLGVNAKINPDLSAFVQIQDTRTWGKDVLLSDSTVTCIPKKGKGADGILGTADDTVLYNDKTNIDCTADQGIDIHQGFVMLNNVGGLPLTLKVGRQELNYGDQRLVGSVGWSNEGRAFDAIKLTYTSGIADVDFWTAKVVENNPAPKGGTADDDTDFYGIYSTVKANPIPDSNLQAYLLLKRGGGSDKFSEKIKDIPGNILVDRGDLKEYTLGARLAGKVSGVGIDYTGEFAYQTGDFKYDDPTTTSVEKESIDISAYAFAVDVGYMIPSAPWGLKVGAEYDYATGTDANSSDWKTFDNLYPTNHLLYGYMDYQAWMNMSDIALKLSAKPTDKYYVYLAYHMLSLAEKDDMWYQANGAAKIVNNTGKDGVGQEIDLLARHTFNQNLKVEAGISQFLAGDIIEATVGSGNVEDSTWAYVMGTVGF